MPRLSRASCQEISRGVRQRFLAVRHSVRLSTVLTAAALSLMLSTITGPAANAQAVYGSIGGTVVDSSGSTVADAKVTITDTARQVVFTTQTDSSGRYDERHLIAGHYQVKIEAQGFKSVLSAVDVSVDSAYDVGRQTPAGCSLGDGNVVDVAPLLKTERTDVSTVLSSKQVNELPTFGRNFSQLLLVTPGTVQFCWGDTSTENPQSGLAVNANGQMFVGVNTILDGTDNRDFLYGNMLIVPNLDSIAETKVTTSSYDAEFGADQRRTGHGFHEVGDRPVAWQRLLLPPLGRDFCARSICPSHRGPSHRQVHSAHSVGPVWRVDRRRHHQKQAVCFRRLPGNARP